MELSLRCCGVAGRRQNSGGMQIAGDLDAGRVAPSAYGSRCAGFRPALGLRLYWGGCLAGGRWSGNTARWRRRSRARCAPGVGHRSRRPAGGRPRLAKVQVAASLAVAHGFVQIKRAHRHRILPTTRRAGDCRGADDAVAPWPAAVAHRWHQKARTHYDRGRQRAAHKTPARRCDSRTIDLAGGCQV